MSRLDTPARLFRSPRGQRGLAAVEFVVTAPFILLLLLGGAEVGRAFVHYATLSYSVRESARYISEHAINGTTGVVALTAINMDRAKNLAVYGNVLGLGTPKLPSYQTAHVQVQDAGGDNVRVTATYPYQPMLGPVLPGFGFGTGSVPLNFDMQVSVTLRAIS
jgi:Flp pilus assembly protein TadG